MGYQKFYSPLMFPGATVTKRFDFSSLAPGTETDGSIITTKATWVAHNTANGAGIKLLLSNTNATGGFASVRVRARSDVATPTWNIVTMAGDFSASANVDNYGEIFGVSGFAQDNGKNQNRVTHWAVGVKAAMGCTGTSSGLRFALWVTDTSTTKAANQHLIRLDKTSSGAGHQIDGVFSVSPCSDFAKLFTFETAGGFLADSDQTLATQAGSIAIQTPAGTRYIPIYSKT